MWARRVVVPEAELERYLAGLRADPAAERDLLMKRRQRETLEELLVIEDVMSICRVSDKTVRRWIKARVLPAALLGGQWRVRPKDLEIFIRDRLTR